MKLIVAGDYCPQKRVSERLMVGDFNRVFGDVKKKIENVDFAIVNLECPVVCGDEKPIDKLGPCLSCTEIEVEVLKWVGFDCVTLANNHFRDYGDVGVENTLKVCEKLDISMVGGGKNIVEASAILYKEICGKCLAVINCCEHEFSIATETMAGSNPLNPIQQYYAIHLAKKRADFVLVIVHGGHEYYSLPSPRMQELYRFFVDVGADAVVNHHQHCFSGYEVYNGKPIFYGLGNFCFDNNRDFDSSWNLGYMVELDTENYSRFSIIPYNQCSKEANVKLLQENAFDKKFLKLNSVIEDKDALNITAVQYYSKCKGEISNILEPSSNRLYLGCKRRGWLPSFISLKRKLRAADYVCCESHRDKLIFYLQSSNSKA